MANFRILGLKAFKNISLTKYHSISLLVFVIFLFNLFLYENSKNFENEFIKSYLLKQLSFVHKIIEKDIQNIFESKNPEHLLIIKNYMPETNTLSAYEDRIIDKIYNSNGDSIIADFSNIFELIEELARSNFFYYIKLNGRPLNKKPINTGDTYTAEFNGKVFDNYLSIIVNLTDNAWIKIESDKRILEKLLYTAVTSIIIFIFLSYIILKYYQNTDRIFCLGTDIQNLREYFQYERSYINDCYEHSKQDQDLLERLDSAGLLKSCNLRDYFPLYLSPALENKLYSLDITKFNFVNLINGYNIINYSNIRVIINDETTDGFVTSNLENQILLQLIHSIIRNFLQFKTHRNIAEEIKITYFDNSIKFECNGIRLNKNHLIKWSKNIFDSTANPFILNFEQIFRILEIFDSESEVKYINDHLILALKFKTTFEEKNKDINSGNVIHINARK